MSPAHSVWSACRSSVCFRDVRDRGAHLSGALEAAVAGERDAVLPRVRQQLWATVPGHAAHGSGTASGPARTHAPAAHLSDGEYTRIFSNYTRFQVKMKKIHLFNLET